VKRQKSGGRDERISHSGDENNPMEEKNHRKGERNSTMRLSPITLGISNCNVHDEIPTMALTGNAANIINNPALSPTLSQPHPYYPSTNRPMTISPLPFINNSMPNYQFTSHHNSSMPLMMQPQQSVGYNPSIINNGQQMFIYDQFQSNSVAPLSSLPSQPFQPSSIIYPINQSLSNTNSMFARQQSGGSIIQQQINNTSTNNNIILPQASPPSRSSSSISVSMSIPAQIPSQSQQPISKASSWPTETRNKSTIVNRYLIHFPDSASHGAQGGLYQPGKPSQLFISLIHNNENQNNTNNNDDTNNDTTANNNHNPTIHTIKIPVKIALKPTVKESATVRRFDEIALHPLYYYCPTNDLRLEELRYSTNSDLTDPEYLLLRHDWKSSISVIKILRYGRQQKESLLLSPIHLLPVHEGCLAHTQTRGRGKNELARKETAQLYLAMMIDEYYELRCHSDWKISSMSMRHYKGGAEIGKVEISFTGLAMDTKINDAINAIELLAGTENEEKKKKKLINQQIIKKGKNNQQPIIQPSTATSSPSPSLSPPPPSSITSSSSPPNSSMSDSNDNKNSELIIEDFHPTNDNIVQIT